ncbi:MAG: hypothetical protein MUF84_01415 [Anaerolineae bacterium]|jgi:hypothetical protein|nr:hypothetical protein [Anaerolineae bacterium]
MTRVGWLRIWLVVTLVVVSMVVAGCSGAWRPPRVTMPRTGPVDVFLNIIDQVSRLGESIARQFRGLARGGP